MTNQKITVRYQAVDNYRDTRKFKTLRGAQRYAQRMVGVNPELARHYAISDDGIGKIFSSIPLYQLFSEEEE
jgi:hypothetical protein